MTKTFEAVFKKTTKMNVFAYFASVIQACETKRTLLKRGRFARYTDPTKDHRDPKRVFARPPAAEEAGWVDKTFYSVILGRTPVLKQCQIDLDGQK